MNTIQIRASRPYEVIIGRGLFANVGEQVRSCTRAERAVVISDSNVWPLYGPQVLESLRSAGLDNSLHFVFAAGEQSKNADTYLQILNFLAANRITRSDCILALGGGVTGDMAGFAAATYLRGIDYIQLPTSLLACVDSSVGGKTAIDLSCGKNLVGAFYQPRLVLCDLDVLDTLPREYFIDGCAEVIKYGVLYDEALFCHLEQFGHGFDREYVVSRCIALKEQAVFMDELDRGERQKLNLGHTLGHSVEACSGYTVSHGRAVAIGMAMIARIACSLGLCGEATAERISALLKNFELPTDERYSAEQLFDAALSDKKRFGEKVNLILPRSIGACIVQSTPINGLLKLIEAGI